MTAQIQVTGPVNIYFGLPGAAGLQGTPGGAAGTPGLVTFLGNCERSPRISRRRYYRPVWNSLAGADIPLDRLYQGEDAFVMARLTRYDEAAYQTLRQLPRTAFQTNNAATGEASGQTALTDVGTAMILEGMTYPLYLQFPYAAKAVYGNQGMRKGYRFLAAMLEGPDDDDNCNTEGKTLTLIWYCGRILNYQPTSGYAGPAPSSFITYDHYMGVMPGVVPPS